MSVAVSGTADLSAGGSQRAAQEAALARLVRTYTLDLQKGVGQSQLDSLAKQIATAAKALGQNVTLPKAPSSGATSNTAAQVPPAGTPTASPTTPPGNTLSVTA